MKLLSILRAGKMNKRATKALQESIVHPPFLRLQIPAQLAKPAPPLGPQLAKRNINIAAFCKDFNARTSHIKEGVPLPCIININQDRSYLLEIIHPPFEYLIRMAAGAKKGASQPGHEVAGKLTLKHVYEIAKLKQEDPFFQTMSLENVCKRVIFIANGIGVEIVRELDVDSYQQFLTDRDSQILDSRNDLADKKKAKLTRTV